jgi:Flp pilus assembly protein TadD
MSDQVLFINVRPAWRRVPLLLVALLALAGAWQGVRWCVGSTMAEHASDLDSAEAATRLAPRNPASHLRLARLHRVTFLPEELPKALSAYERAAALAPNDYLIWTELGRARGASGDTAGAERALRRAAELAPAYAEPRWHLGNLLLRAGRVDEGFAELRRAADAHPERFRPQVFNLAWQLYEQDMPRVVAAVGETPAARAQLVGVLLGRGRADDAHAVWETLGAAEKRKQRAAGEALARALHEGKQYRRALQVLGEAGEQVGGAEKISNGGFESDMAATGAGLFQWRVTPGGAAAQVALDPRGGRGGSRALRVAFNAPSQIDFSNVRQTVAVEPRTHYRLSFYVRTSELKSASTPVAVVSDAAAPEPQALAASASAPAGTSEWQEVSVEFTTGERTEAVEVRLARAPCPDGVCPIYGKIWYHDFDLQRAGGRAAAAR